MSGGTYTTVPSPPVTGQPFSLYYTYPSSPPLIVAGGSNLPNNTYQLRLQNQTNTVYGTFYSNEIITSNTINTPYFIAQQPNTGALFISVLDTPSICQLNTDVSGYVVVIGTNLSNPRGLSFQDQNTLWVVDNIGLGVIKKFTYSASSWSLSTTLIPTLISSNIWGMKYNSGYVYVCDQGNQSNQCIFQIDTLGSTTPTPTIYTNTNTTYPFDLAFDTSGNLYFSNGNNGSGNPGSIIKFDGTNTTILVDSTTIGSDPSNFSNPYGIALDSSQTKLYVSGFDTSSIYAHVLGGIANNFTSFIIDNDGGTGPSGLINPVGIFIDSINDMYVVNAQASSYSSGYVQKIIGIQYNFLNMTAPTPYGSYPLEIYNATTSSVVTNTDFNLQVQCFLKGTKILCMVNNIESWVRIEELKPGDLVKTYTHGFIKVINIGKSLLQNSINFNPNKLFKISKEKFPELGLIDDLYVTGKHSRLVDNLNEEQKNKTLTIWNKLQKIDGKYLLMAWIDEDFIDIKDKNIYEIYQVVLESNRNDFTQQYGIWANGLLSESMSLNTFKMKKQLKPIF